MTRDQTITGSIRASGIAIDRRHINSRLPYRPSVYVNYQLASSSDGMSSGFCEIIGVPSRRMRANGGANPKGIKKGRA